MIKRRMPYSRKRISENARRRSFRNRKLNESKSRRFRKLNEYYSQRYDDDLWDKLDCPYISTSDYDYDQMVKDHCECTDADPADYPEGSQDYWNLVSMLVNDELEADEQFVRDCGMDEVCKFLRSKGYDQFDSDDLGCESDRYGDSLEFFWKDKTLNWWARHEFLTDFKDFLKQNGFDEAEIDTFEQLFLAEHCANGCFTSGYPMDKDDVDIVFYNEPDLKAKLLDPKILDGIKRIHNDAFKRVFDLANESMKVLKKACGLK